MGLSGDNFSFPRLEEVSFPRCVEVFGCSEAVLLIVSAGMEVVTHPGDFVFAAVAFNELLDE